MGIHRGCCAQAVHPDPFANAGKLPAMEATLGLRKCRSLQPWNEEAQRIRACDGAAFAEATRAATEAEVRWRQEEGERRRRSKLVHNIARVLHLDQNVRERHVGGWIKKKLRNNKRTLNPDEEGRDYLID